FHLVVGDVHRGKAHPAVHLHQLHAQLFTYLGVDVGERFVEHHTGRIDRQSARQRDTLLLTPTELGGVAVDEFGDPHPAQECRDPVCDLVLRDLVRTQWVGDVVEDGHVWPQRVGLEHHVDAASFGGQVDLPRRRVHSLAGDGDLAALGGLQTGDRSQQSGLSAAARTEEHHELTRGDVQRDVIQGPYTLPTLLPEGLAEPLSADPRFFAVVCGLVGARFLGRGRTRGSFVHDCYVLTDHPASQESL